ncbi:hypothetical protein [Lentzea sp. NBRC 102530]|uniref:hypothetical protein n=1 Tax=Lentzea sp. NBRC 102530 TaxID=3032201 RepID=UPI002553A1D2|nr:hypothetical protein [Lentzea sp. NBRC 102530]
MVVQLSFAQASVLARAAVVVTSAMECKEINVADQGLLAIRRAVALALSQDVVREAGGPPAAESVPKLRAG